MTRVGLLGGSFNPAHAGHRRITLAAIRALALDEAWWLVSPGNPLKPEQGMAPLAARLASARRMARRAPIRPSTIEARLGTRYTIDTMRALKRRYPRTHFIWVMGSDNLAQFHRWKGWRAIAREVPIAVIARPGYEGRASASPAAGWLRRFRRPAGQANRWTTWELPAFVLLRFRPDPMSATQVRAGNPAWFRQFLPDAPP
ncbi:nicotinate-nucleotide adenylyltransferase [Sphingomonas sp. CROZ-RG-20F-R02-07]|uniref:nicotinate-nucleotide adenylyltransferase n=1 Tax=Sphingomonas sp. CROZ-RG-20F-R02-07 TaxID=2914832 RepID=UPI001F5A30F1